MPHIFQGYEGATLGAELATSDAGSRNDGQINQAVAKNTGSSIRAVAEPIIGDGAQALRVEFAANAAAYVRHAVQPASATTRCSWTVPFRAGNPLALAVEVLAFRSSSGSVGKLSVSPGGLFSIQAVNTTIAQGPAVQPGGVYWLCLAVTPGTTTSNGRIEWEIYERYGTTPIWSGDTGATVNIGTAAVSLVQVGSSGPPSTASSQDYDAWTVTTELASGFPPRSEYPRPLAENYQGVTAVPLHYMRAGGGTGSDMAMVNGALRISTATTSDSVSQWVNAFHTRAPASADSAGILAMINTPTMVGGEMIVGLSDRGGGIAPDNGFSLRLTLNGIGQTASVDIIRYVNGTATVVPSGNLSGLMLGGDQWVRLERLGQTVRYKIWSALGAEPAAWTRSVDTLTELGSPAQTRPVRARFTRRVTSVSGGGSMDIYRSTIYDPALKQGTGEAPMTVSGSAVSTPRRFGSGSAPFTLDAAAVSTPRRSGSGVASMTVTATGTGTPRRAGVGPAQIILIGTGAGTPSRRGMGTGSITVDGTGTGTAKRRATGAASFLVDGTAAATPKRSATGSAPLQVTATGTGAPKRAAAGQAPIILDATGTAQNRRTGTGVAAMTLDGTGTGSRRRTGAATAAMTLDGQGAGSPKRRASEAATIITTGAAIGIPQRRGTGSGVLQVTASAISAPRRSGDGLGRMFVGAVGYGAAMRRGTGQAPLLVDGVGLGHPMRAGASSAEVLLRGDGEGLARRADIAVAVMVLDGAQAANRPDPRDLPPLVGRLTVAWRRGALTTRSAPGALTAERQLTGHLED